MDQITADHQLRGTPVIAQRPEPGHHRPEVPQVSVQVGGGEKYTVAGQLEDAGHDDKVAAHAKQPGLTIPSLVN